MDCRKLQAEGGRSLEFCQRQPHLELLGVTYVVLAVCLTVYRQDVRAYHHIHLGPVQGLGVAPIWVATVARKALRRAGQPGNYRRDRCILRLDIGRRNRRHHSPLHIPRHLAHSHQDLLGMRGMHHAA